MFSLGPGSICDVCLEPFGADLKAPSSISCGHVFCADCLNHITRQTCPLCRVPFNPRSIVRLHVDLDSVKSLPAGPGGESMLVEQEASALHDRIAAVANAGSTEANLRALISDCRAFLSNQPRTQFQDLRFSVRMITFLCDVKSKLRSKDQDYLALEEKLEKGRAEYDELQVRLLELDGARKEAVNAKRKSEGEKKELQAAAVQRELELTQKVSELQNKYIELLE
ncbi:hypothetical protein F5878DRAFT_531436 [Lentinula raphanica]|uniref:RING-type domain-containing protein n=1 Tax=Lentinula raphanica TaxID=153919 RepID=A0AA38PFG1_9AGAR|nr:hypothetical protein C8R42DRAFT_582439 [Lentinula raphanica]KAJ3759383.1 hypothetical protein EV360DRAFT_41977 [Lentinula raphanica]KAJ3841596.1 hypothetical protein F5878DRAFT_531436 [Lentinula raphanica]